MKIATEWIEEPNRAEAMPVVETQPLPKIYYAGRGGYAIEHAGKFIPLTCAEVVVQHLKPYLGKKGN